MPVGKGSQLFSCIVSAVQKQHALANVACTRQQEGLGVKRSFRSASNMKTCAKMVSWSIHVMFSCSGFLVAFGTFKLLKKNKGRLNWALFYIHRYLRSVLPKSKSRNLTRTHSLSTNFLNNENWFLCRLTPTYAFVLCIWLTIFLHSFRGPYEVRSKFQFWVLNKNHGFVAKEKHRDTFTAGRTQNIQFKALTVLLTTANKPWPGVCVWLYFRKKTHFRVTKGWLTPCSSALATRIGGQIYCTLTT